MDELLVKLILSGDEEAYNRLQKKYDQYTRYIAKQFMGAYFENNIVEYEQLVNKCKDAFEEAIKTYDSEKEAKFKTYVSSVFTNVCKNHMRYLHSGTRAITKEKISIDVFPGDDSSGDNLSYIEIADNNAYRQPHRALMIGEEKRQLKVAIEKLTHHEKMVLQLSMRGYSKTDIAKIMKINMRSVSNALLRARDKIRNTL